MLSVAVWRALQARQPWADIEAPVQELTEEHREYIAKMKAEKGETEPEDGEKKVRLAA